MTEESSFALVGITGGIGGGKSSVAEIFRERGFIVFDADVIASEIIEQEKNVREELREKLGGSIIKPDGSFDRAAASRLVFGDTPEHSNRLRELNRIVHPRVLDRLWTQIEAARESGKKIVLADIALLFEAGLEDAFDYIILVTARESERINRVMKRAGLTEEQVRQRMNSQDSDETKKVSADFIIENNGAPEDLRKSVEFIADILPMLPPKAEDDDEIQGEAK